MLSRHDCSLFTYPCMFEDIVFKYEDKLGGICCADASKLSLNIFTIAFNSLPDYICFTCPYLYFSWVLSFLDWKQSCFRLIVQRGCALVPAVHRRCILFSHLYVQFKNSREWKVTWMWYFTQELRCLLCDRIKCHLYLSLVSKEVIHILLSIMVFLFKQIYINIFYFLNKKNIIRDISCWTDMKIIDEKII